MAGSFTTRLGNAPEEGIKAPCVVASSSNITLSGEQTINTVAVVAGDRVLVRAQTDPLENGIYDASDGAWARAKDWNNANDVISGVLVVDVQTNAIYQGTFTGEYTPGTTTVTFTTVGSPYEAGADLQLDLVVKSTAFTVAASTKYLVNTAGGAISVTMPSSPTIGDRFGLIDLTGSWSDATALTLLYNSTDDIMRESANYVINVQDANFVMIFTSSGWVKETIDTLQGTFNTVALLQANDVDALRTVTVLGHTTAGDGGGGTFWLDTSDTSTPDNVGTNIVDSQSPRTGTWKRVYAAPAMVTWFGALGGGTIDDTAAIQAAADANSWIHFPDGTYRCDSALVPASDSKWTGTVGGVELLQYGPYLFQPGDSLQSWHLSGFTLRLSSGSTDNFDCAFSMKAHRDCVIENLELLAYDEITVIERMPVAASTHNTIDNVYRDWTINACANLDVAIGLEGYYHLHQGDGATTVIATGQVWPETFDSSVVVIEENFNRIFRAMDLTTDYTVAYDGSDNLTVTMASAPSASTRIHIWPAMPRTDAGAHARRPISNNVWERIKTLYIFKRGFQAIRWVDAETYRDVRLMAGADNVILWVFNPGDRNGQGGDFMHWDAGVISYQGEVGFAENPSTLKGISFGPGTVFNTSHGLAGDLVWRHSGNNKLIEVNDTETTVLTGNVTTDGTAVVLGSGTEFTKELTLIGSVPDTVIIEGVIYGIASIDSATQLTTTVVVPVAAAVAISRYNYHNAVSYDMQFRSTGEGQLVSDALSIGHYIRGSASQASGTATMAISTTAITVPFKLSRLPTPGEIHVTAHSGLAGRSIQVSNITLTSFNINVNTSAAAEYTFGYSIELRDIN